MSRATYYVWHCLWVVIKMNYFPFVVGCDGREEATETVLDTALRSSFSLHSTHTICIVGGRLQTSSDFTRK